jgi:hypothetical protein
MEKTLFVFGDIPSNLLVPHISNPLKMAPHWNNLDDHVMFSMFGFVNKYLEANGYMVMLDKDFP